MKRDLQERRTHGNAGFSFQTYRDFVRKGHSIFIACHWHSELEIIFIEEGMFEITVEGKVYTGKKGDIYFFNAGQLHQIYADQPDSTYHSMVFSTNILMPKNASLIEEAYMDGENGKWNFPVCILTSHKDYVKISNCIENIFSYHKKKGAAWQLKILSYLYELFAIFIERGLFVSKISYEHKVPSITTIRTKKLLAYIEEHYMEKITIEEAANMMHLTPKYFCSYFHQNFYMSFVTYLNRYRIHKACILLQTTTLPMIEIALSTGFSNAGYFTRKFKEIEGYSPSEYRKKLTSFHK